jgi:hypothetical protein
LLITRVAYSQPRPATQAVTLTKVEPVAASVSVPPLLQQGSVLYVAQPKDANPDKRVKFADILKNLGAGVTAAAPPVKLIQLSHTTTHAELVGYLTTNNVYNLPANQADQVASSALDLLKTPGAQAVCIGLAGGGMAIGVMEAFTPDWSWERKLTVAAIIAVIAAALFYVLLTRGG